MATPKKAAKKASDRGQWISKAIKHHGQLHTDLGVPGNKKIPRAQLLQASQRRDVVGERARLALTLEHLNR